MADRRDVLDAHVAVVGAGPAGCATAIACARAGLSVVLLEHERFPRDRPGETLHPGVEVPLRELGVLESVSEAGFLRHEGVKIGWDAEPRLVPYGGDAAGPWQGFQAWRADFDTILLERARELGVHVLQPCRALRPMLTEGRVKGIETSRGTVNTRYVVDAAGSRHWLAKRLQLTLRRRSPRLLARYGYLKGACTRGDEAPSIVADEGGWIWTAMVRPGLYNWTRLNLDGDLPGAGCVPEGLRGLRPHGRSRGSEVGWRAVEVPAGPGYYLVGDAAAVLDPASSHGVLKGILSGMMAAHLIVKAFSGSEHILARSYGTWLASWFDHDVTILRDLYSRLPSPPPWLNDFVAAPTALIGAVGSIQEPVQHENREKVMR